MLSISEPDDSGKYQFVHENSDYTVGFTTETKAPGSGNFWAPDSTVAIVSNFASHGDGGNPFVLGTPKFLLECCGLNAINQKVSLEKMFVKGEDLSYDL